MNETRGEKTPFDRFAKQIVIRILLLAILLSSALVSSAGSVNASSAQETVLQVPTQINFNTYTPTPFGSEDINPIMTIEDGGNTLHLKGNSWKKISLPYTVTPYTVVEFDFKSPMQGELQGIGFDNNEAMSSNFMYKIYGTQSWGINIAYYKYADFAPGWRHYRIPVGEQYTGEMLYLVFMNDHDVSNPTGESYFSNVKVFEDLSLATQPLVDVDFNSYTISPYDGASQSPALTMTIEDNGDTLHLLGNGWLKMSLPYAVTTSTVVEFDFKSGLQGDIQGIGFDTDNTQQANRTFQLYGTQAWGMDAFGYSRYASDWKHYRIPVGKYYTGEMRYIFFTNDHDISNPTAESYFRNLRIYEGEISLPVSIDFDQYALSPFYSPQGNNTPMVNVLDSGATLHLSGNGWIQVSMPISILPNTFLEFDFKSTAQGEVHGVGFDTDQIADSSKTFKLFGTQDYGLMAFNDYAASAPEWKHYVIPAGQYYAGEMLYLFFGNDHDVANPTAESYFKNVQIHVQTSTYSYNRAAAVAYADEWAHDRNDDYPLANENGCFCNDCTNYISQVLHEGGYPLRTGNWDENSLFEWWFRDGSLFQPDYSKTWSVTDWFYNYTKIYNTEFEEKADVFELMTGDFILLDLQNNDDPDDPSPDGKPDHGRVIVGEGYPSEYEIDYISQDKDIFGKCHTTINPVPTPPGIPVLLINQHCIDRWHVVWNYNLTSGDRKFYIHVTD